MRKLSVLFLSSWYPNELLIQNGNFIQQHARAVSLYCNVAALHVQSKDQKHKISVTYKYNEGVLEVIVYYKKINSNTVPSALLKKKRQHEAFLEGYATVLKKMNTIDLVHLNVILPAGFFALYIKKKYDIPFIITEHSTVYLNQNPDKHGFIEKYFVKKITRKADYICPVSNDLKTAMINYGIIGKFVVIPNVVNTKIFHLGINKKPSKTNILHVSTLKNSHKNIKGILRVIKELSNIRSDFTFRVIGDGNIEQIKEYANKIKLKKQFYNIQSQKPTEIVAEAMQSSHLFILFSNYENSPCVISESLVSGVPVLSTDVGGISEMISKDNGVLVGVKQEDNLFKELNLMIDNLEFYNGGEIAANAVLKYSYETVAKQYLDLYYKTLDFE